jgi:hypothetical protein
VAAKSLLLLAICGAVSLVALETVYRLQPVDTYRGELRLYNEREDLERSDSRPTVLLMGDSLTAGTRSYPAAVRRARPDWRVINAGIPGSCVIQANLVAPRRFRDFEPSVFVYQVNVGNDLINLRYPINWRAISPVRNLYWSLSRHARSLEYLNYKLGQLVGSSRYQRAVAELRATGRTLEEVVDSDCRFDFADFDPAIYTERIVRYFQAEPEVLENQIEVGPTRLNAYRRLLEGLRRLLVHCEEPDCTAFLLVVPHASQVHRGYYETMRQLGARFGGVPPTDVDSYPFLEGILEFLEENGLGHVRIVDALPELREVEHERRAFYLHDAHLNPCGQEALARLVLSEVLPVSSHGDHREPDHVSRRDREHDGQ